MDVAPALLVFGEDIGTLRKERYRARDKVVKVKGMGFFDERAVARPHGGNHAAKGVLRPSGKDLLRNEVILLARNDRENFPRLLFFK